MSTTTAAEPRWREIDERIWREELEQFVPAKIFDVHTHIYRWDFNTDPQKESSGYAKFATKFPIASRSELDRWDAALLPGRTVNRLSFPFPFPQCDFDASNRYVAAEAADHAGSAALMLVHPAMQQDAVEQVVREHGFVGFKPYRNYSRTGDIDNCRITDFLPEDLLEVADRHGLLVMMHLSRRDAIADELNLTDLQALSVRYPNVKWILAHCARSYSSWALDRAAAVLRDLPNVWFDTSSVCETDAMVALFQAVGPERVMYGSDDLPVGALRGKYVTFGFAWAFLSEENHALNLSHCNPDMTFTRYEQLRAMYRASQRMGYDEQINRMIFHDTASALVASVRSAVSKLNLDNS